MDTAVKFNKDIEVSFINVATLAAESKRQNELEEEAKKFYNRSKDEVNAAVALIIMRYQPNISQKRQPTKTYEDLKYPSQRFPKKCGSESLMHSDYYSLKKFRTHDTPCFKPQKHTGGIKFRNYETKSSLLTSCRNILKDFLNQNRQS